MGFFVCLNFLRIGAILKADNLFMKEKIKTQKGFIQIPLLVIIIASIAIASAGTGVVLHKQGKLAPLVANISEVFKGTEEPTAIKPEEAKPEESLEQPQTEQEPEESQTEQELEKTRLEAEKAKQETEKIKLENERLKAEQEAQRLAEEQRQREIAKQEELERQRQLEEQKKQEELKKQQEIQRLVEEQKRQEELQKQKESQRLAEEQARQERERQLQVEYSYYIEKLATIKNNLLNKKEITSSSINQIDSLLNQDKNKALLDYQNALLKAERDFNLKITQIGEYYAARGLTFSGMRNAAEAEAKEDYERYIQLLGNAYKQSLTNLENYYNQKEQELGQLLNTINSKIKDIDYLTPRLQQKILSEADKLLLNRALSY